VTGRDVKKLPNFSKSTQNCLQTKPCQNIYIKAEFESPKHLHQTTFETLNIHNKLYLGENTINLFKQKVAQNVTISLGYFIFKKIIMSLQRCPIGKKTAQSGHSG
jgi:hypothetical protein